MGDTKESFRYGDYLREVTARHEEISYNKLAPKDSVNDGKKIQLRGLDVYRLLQPYIGSRFSEQVYSLMPLSIYLILFQLFLLRHGVSDGTTIAFGLLAVIVGLMFFLEGIKVGLMPLGEAIGNTLPKKVGLFTVLLIAFLLGIGVTFAEPAIGALKTAGSLVVPEKSPYLYALLNIYTGSLVLLVGVGVGFAAIVGTIRFLYGFSLKPCIYISLIPTMALTIYFMNNPDLAPVLGLAWDSGGVTTGPVTVPLVLALGIGIASAAGKGDSSLSGFGIVTLASIFPIIGVMLLALYVYFTTSPDQILAIAQTMAVEGVKDVPLSEQSPYIEIILGLRAIVPLVLFLFFVMKFIIKDKIKNRGTIFYGISLSIIGMIIFNLGLTYGLAKLGGQTGSLVPAAFNTISVDGEEISALYPYGIGLTVAIIFAYILGFGATLAEPALNALGLTVQNLTQGVFKKKMLIYAVSIGVGIGITIGVIKIIFNIPLGWLLIPSYIIAVILTYFSTEEFVNIAWDSAGVTTGPVTVPLVLAMGLGFGNALGAAEGFGILSMASICPILTVLSTGLWANYKAKREKNLEKGEIK